MNRYWETVTRPLLEAADPRIVVEIGAEAGLQTRPLLDFCAAHGATAHVIDPKPEFDVEGWEREYGPAFRFHRARSLDVIGTLPPADAALIDGDHNWYTVFHELSALESRALALDRLPPVLILHDVGWPYGRRDLYYDPDSIPAEHRHSFHRAGLERGRSKLVSGGGLNPHLQHALHEGSERNGVLTALEDFLAASGEDYTVLELPAFSGLAVLVPAARAAQAGELAERVDRFGSAAFQAELVRLVEDERLRGEIRTGAARRHADQARGWLATVEHDLSESEARLRDANTRRSELEGRIAELEGGNAELEGRIGELQGGNAELEGRIAELQGRIAELEGRIGELQGGNAELEGRIADLQGRNAELEAEVSKQGARLADAEAARLELEAGLIERDTQLRDAAREAAAAAGEREAARERREAARMRLAERLDRQRQALSRVQAGQASAALNVRRAVEGQAWRVGHRLALIFRWLTLRPPAGRETSLDVALRLLPDPGAPAGGSGGSNAVAELANELAATEEALREEGAVDAMRPRPADRSRPPAAAPEVSAAAAREGLARTLFEARYGQILRRMELQPGEGDVGDVVPSDGRGLLRGAGTERPAEGPAVDVVVAVHDALEDVRRCLFSLLEKGSHPFRLIVVDDGSGPATAAFLRAFAARHPSVTLLHNAHPPHGYTVAANLGIQASTGDWVVLLNSDTVVTPGWLERLVACGESGERIGLVGPLSNAASHQSVPFVREAGRWATNDLPQWLHPDAMALAVEGFSSGTGPRLPFLNGFCLAIKREVFDRIGVFDEENFGAGYCEENDFAYRAAQAGFELAVADDVYVLHSKSRSYTDAGRAALAKTHYDRFLEKHGASDVEARVRELEAATELDALRERLAPLTESEESFRAAFPSVRVDGPGILFVLPGMSRGSSGGAHSVYQEVKGMRALGIRAKVAIGSAGWKHARAAYPDADQVFVPFRDEVELARVAAGYEVVVATHFRSVALVARVVAGTQKLAAYYIQDYEPFFVEEGSAEAEEALASYAALPDGVCFAKTHWLCNLVAANHGVQVAKVEPSLDHGVYRPSSRGRDLEGPVRVIAMVRPRTTRRQPVATAGLLERLVTELGDRVEVAVFGCSDRDLARVAPAGGSALRNLGVLTREGVAQALAESDVFVDASSYQAFGRTALESMACGCTCVVPAVGGVREFARQGENSIIVDTTDPETLFGAVAGLVVDRPRIERLRAGALRTAEGFSVSRAALSEYLLLEREHRRRVSPPPGATRPVPAGGAPRRSPASSTPAG